MQRAESPSPDASVAGALRLPHALDDHGTLRAEIGGRRLLIFLDYDGTLSPIVGRPQDALLDPAMRGLLERLAARDVLGVVSGRALADLRGRVGLAGAWYAGNHGFEIEGPEGSGIHREVGAEYVDELRTLGERLTAGLAGVPGALVECKRYSLSIHYRLVAPDRVASVIDAVEAAAAAHPRLALRSGKRVLELRPALEWHKGTAVRWLAGIAGAPGDLPLFVGDDLTDEDAFREIRDDGIGVLVAETPRDTAARYWLRDVEEVRRFLVRLAG